MNTSSSSSTPAPSSPFLAKAKPRVHHVLFQLQPAEAWLIWGDDNPPAPSATPAPAPAARLATPSPSAKRAKLPGGQFTLTQFMPREEPAPPVLPVQVPKATYPVAPHKRDPRIVANDAIVSLLEKIQEDLEVLMDQIRDSYFMFDHGGAFKQEKWAKEGLTKAIRAVEVCPVTVSVMGLNDMKDYLPQIDDIDTLVLIKNLSKYHGYGIWLDLDQEHYCCNFIFVHELYLKNAKTAQHRAVLSKYEYGGGTSVELGAFAHEDN